MPLSLGGSLPSSAIIMYTHPHIYMHAHAQLIRVIKLFGLDRSRGEEEKTARTIFDTVLEIDNDGCSKNNSTTWSEYYCILVPAHFRILACILAAYSSILDCITSSSAVIQSCDFGPGSVHRRHRHPSLHLRNFSEGTQIT